jgi:hypothetical protein
MPTDIAGVSQPAKAAEGYISVMQQNPFARHHRRQAEMTAKAATSLTLWSSSGHVLDPGLAAMQETGLGEKAEINEIGQSDVTDIRQALVRRIEGPIDLRKHADRNPGAFGKIAKHPNLFAKWRLAPLLIEDLQIVDDGDGSRRGA